MIDTLFIPLRDERAKKDGNDDMVRLDGFIKALKRFALRTSFRSGVGPEKARAGLLLKNGKLIDELSNSLLYIQSMNNEKLKYQ